MKTILSGVKPTGKPHIGNYFGAMRQFPDMQDKFYKESKENRFFFMIADYHALNFIQNPEKMKKLTEDLVIDFLAIGVDPEKSVIFKQSDVPAHTELTWIFNTITTVPYLKRAHAYKDAVAKGGEDEISVGTFNYPMLMAADILLYSPDLVPVGQDQKQHIEFARDTAEKFNRIFGNTEGADKPSILKLPEGYILENVQTVPGIDGRKMSKSYNNYIALFAEDEEIEEKVMSIVTDSGGEKPENVFKIHRLFRSDIELDKIYEENKGEYKKLKELLIEDIKNFIRPLREKRAEIAKSPEKVKEILEKGREKAQAVAGAKLLEIKRSVGVV